MALPANFPIIPPVAPVQTGIIVRLVPSDASFEMELERAPDASGVPGTPVTIARIRPAPLGSGTHYTDRLPVTGALYYYRHRNVRAGLNAGLPGSWSRRATAKFLDGSNLPPSNPVPIDPVPEGRTTRLPGDLVNLVMNGGFEEGMNYWRLGTAGTGDLELGAGRFKGLASLRLVSNGSIPTSAIQIDDFGNQLFIPVTPGERYHFAAAAKMGSVHASQVASVGFSGYSDAKVFVASLGLLTFRTETAWTEKGTAFTVPAGVYYVALEAGTQLAAINFFLDEIRLFHAEQGALNAVVFTGTTAGQRIQGAVDSLAATGGTLDLQGFESPIVLDVDICANLDAFNIKPYTFLWGHQEVRVAVKQTLRSHHHHVLNGTTFISKDGSGTRVTGVTMFQFDHTTLAIGGPGNGVITTNDSAVVTRAAPSSPPWGALELDSPISVFGIVPLVGRDNNQLNGAIGTGDTTITVDNTTGFPSNGYIRIEDEVINYTGTTATTFTGCTRGFQGTTAATHADNTAVDRCVYRPNYVIAISGNDNTLEEQVDFTSTNGQIRLGALDICFSGVGTFDGNKHPSTDDTANPYGIQIIGGRYCHIGPGIVFKRFDHGGYDLEQCQDCTVDAKHLDCGRIGSSLGAGGWMFGWNRRVNLAADVVDCNIGLVVDDRSTTASLQDGAPEDCTVVIRTSRGTPLPLEFSGTRNCHGEVKRASDIGAASSAISANVAQWITGGSPGGNVLRVGSISGAAGFQNLTVATGWTNNTFLIDTMAFGIGSTLRDNNSLVTPKLRYLLTYGTTVTVLPDRAEDFQVVATNGTAFTMANPATTSRTRARRLSIIITNSSGGALGTITWGGDFVLAGAFTSPANGTSRRITFVWNEGVAKWQEESRTAADM